MKMMFLDESGDHSLAHIQKDYPLFVLGGIVVDEGYATGELDCKVKEFKR